MDRIRSEHLDLGGHQGIAYVDAVPLSVLLAEREARETERRAQEKLIDQLRAIYKDREAQRDAAVARAERAERDVEKLTDDYRAALDDAKREWDRAEQAEAERDEARNRVRQLEGLLREILERELDENPALWKRARAALGNDEGTSTPRCVSNPDRSCGSLSPGFAPVCRRCPNREAHAVDSEVEWQEMP